MPRDCALAESAAAAAVLADSDAVRVCEEPRRAQRPALAVKMHLVPGANDEVFWPALLSLVLLHALLMMQAVGQSHALLRHLKTQTLP